jgi:hypothetical protein
MPDTDTDSDTWKFSNQIPDISGIGIWYRYPV